MKLSKKTLFHDFSKVIHLSSTAVIFFLLIALYTIAMLSVIHWGIPGNDIAYPYHMDEWHQFMGVTSLVKHFSNNESGASRGPMFFFIQTSFFLGPFVLLHLIHPSLLAHHFIPAGLTELHYIFIILRLYILILGILTLILIYLICKQYLHTNPLLGVLFLATSPLWISWSNYYKYDLAVAFWIVFSLYYLLRYKNHANNTTYYITGIIIALAIATKISAIPLTVLYILAFFIFTPQPLKYKSRLIIGLVILCIVFSLVGIPDILFLGKNWGDYITVDIVNRRNSIFGLPWYDVLLTEHYPLIFGHGLYFLLIITGLFYVTKIKMLFRKNALEKYNHIVFLALGLLLFSASLISLEAGAVSERLFVVLPFAVILVTMAMTKLSQKYPLLFITLICCVLAIQIFECYTWLSIKWGVDPKRNSSVWITLHIKPGSTIALENVPIYQGIPNSLLLDYYRQQALVSKGTYKYEILENAKVASKYVVVTNADPTELFDPTSPKSKLLTQLNRNGYRQLALFKPDLSLYSYFGDEKNFYFSGLVPTNMIIIYSKKN